MREPQSDALRGFLHAGQHLVSSVVAMTELRRAAARVGGPSALSPQVDAVLAEVALLPFDLDVARAAAALGPPSLRTLDAIHLASALALGDDLDVLVAYDEGLLAAAAALGIGVTAPR